MFSSYFRIAIRSLKKQRLYAAVNIFGLAVGLAICLIAIGHLTYELSFEDSHAKRDRIYRVNLRYQSEDSDIYSARVMPALGLALVEEIPEVEKAALFRVLGNVELRVGEEGFPPLEDVSRHGYEHSGNVFCANPGFLNVFTFPLLQGDPKTVLREPFSVIVTERACGEYFHGIDPIGQVVSFNDSLQCRVTGILRDVPENTQLHCDFIISYSTLERIGENARSWDDIRDDYVFLLLSGSAVPGSVERKIRAVFERHCAPEEASKYSFELQPLEDIYFSVYGSGRRGELYPAGEASMIYTIGFTALFVLIIAIANFVNLSTARSADRMREVGVRKVLGAFRSDLIKQFLGESFVITSVAFVIGLVIYEIFKHSIRSSLPREALADFYSNGLMLVLILGLLAVVGLLAGYYPALYLSRFRPIAVLQGKSFSKSSKSVLRRALVIFQFAIAIGFVCCTAITFQQTRFITSYDLGFRRENILVLSFEGENAAGDCMLMKNEILSGTPVLSATAANCPPGRREWHTYAFYTDEAREDMVPIHTYLCDYDFISTFDLEVIQGRGFSENHPADVDHGLIINESAAAKLGIDNPIGHKLYREEDRLYEIVGVVRDFHGSPLNFAYQSVSAMMLNPERAKTLSIHLQPQDLAGSLSAIERIWNSTLPGQAFNYSFLDEEISHNYDSDKGPMMMMAVLSVLTIAIACLGVLALVSFIAEGRTKEIGIRRVLGASVSQIVVLLLREFILLIAIANVVAWPLAYLMMSDYLREFPFRVSIGFGTFMMTGVIAISVALLTASFQAIRAARTNPVDTLKYE